ncbi:hypothetical protein C8Q76DRAFT_762346 [Earliella scabrosa]|nr:hypothetical protein C8Q76DRAFT_762346 [Earliella scabrosa]
MSVPSDAVADAVALTMKLRPRPASPWETREAKRARRAGRKGKEPTKVEPKNPRKLRGRAGRLAGLMEVSKDIFYEIVSWLKPLDLLHLARASKFLRSLLMSKDSITLWKAARKNIPGLPDCPDILAEPRYAAVVFDQYCFACGIARSSCTDYALALRLCAPCCKTNIREGKHVEGSIVPLSIKTKMWSMVVSSSSFYTSAEPEHNNVYHKYYVAELYAVYEEMIRLKSDQAGLQHFVADRQNFTRHMQMHGHAVGKWYHDGLTKRFLDGRQSQMGRRKAIKEKLRELGYSKTDYPKTAAWNKILNQRAELTDRIWKNIRPKLEILLAQEKDDRAAAREGRLRIRHEEIRVLYDAFVSERFPEDEQCFFPNRCDISSLPSIKELAQTNDARATITMDLFATIEDRLLSDIQQHAVQAGCASTFTQLLAGNASVPPCFVGWRET